MRDDEHRAAYVGYREIHLVVFIAEDPKVHGLLDEEGRVRIRIACTDAEENENPASDLTGDLAVHRDLCTRNALQDSPHYSSI